MQSSVLAQKFFGFNLHRHLHRQARDHFIPHEGNGHQPHVLRHRVLALYSVLLVLVKVSVVGLPALLPYETIDSAAITSENIVQLTNQARKDFQLPALESNPKLAVAALNKARDMIQEGYFAHFSPGGVSPWYWITQSGYGYSYAGENLAIRFSTAEGVNDAWLASAAHRANILSRDFSEIGVAVITDNFADQGIVTLAVQMFATPAAVARAPSKTPQTTQAVTKPQTSNIVSRAVAAPPKEEAVLPAPPARPQITFPFDNSFVNTARFQMLGRAAAGADIEFSIDGQVVGHTVAVAEGTFEFKLPPAVILKDGSHQLVAALKGSKAADTKASLTFQLDTTPPEIFAEKFLMSPHISDSKSYDVQASVAKDSIRTIVSVGQDSAVLSKSSAADLWTGQITLYHRAPRQSLPIELFVQDLAGNQNKQRVGTLNDGHIQGLYSFISGSVPTERTFSVFGISFKINNFELSLKHFYLYFVAFLAFALILKIAIARHVRHLPTVAGASAVMILAMILFMV